MAQDEPAASGAPTKLVIKNIGLMIFFFFFFFLKKNFI